MYSLCCRCHSSMLQSGYSSNILHSFELGLGTQPALLLWNMWYVDGGFGSSVSIAEAIGYMNCKHSQGVKPATVDL